MKYQKKFQSKRMISFQTIQVQFHEQLQSLQQILKQQTNGVKQFTNNKSKQTPLMASAQFLTRATEFLQILAQTTDKNQVNELAKNLAILSGKMEEMNRILGSQRTVSYTHLTLPTKRIVQISFVLGS
eukprot:TRINITY_DN6169_c0_g1_i1.p1 TRINITY_DN6169_c0_g1~~TRINITY_DN6169_c0_g1_i1.p1  ORF type:complete len:128 (-),score=17.40 TRINITY_DN6169_c0_g1_i1:63-446(-)